MIQFKIYDKYATSYWNQFLWDYPGWSNWRNGMKRIALLLVFILIFISGCGPWPMGLPLADLSPIINTFEASPSIIKQGEVAQLRWNVSMASSVSIDGGIGNVALSGNIPVVPTGTTFYTLTAKNPAGTSTTRTQIIVSGLTAFSPPPISQPLPPIIQSFNASRNVILPGEPVNLSWDVSEATQITLSPYGIVNAHDRITVNPIITTTYVLTAVNSTGSSTQPITITILNQPAGSEGIVPLKLITDESGSLVKGSSYYTFQKNTCAGDTSLNLASRAFLSFDISAIPQAAVIKEAILDLGNYTKMGNPTYVTSMWGNMGAFEVYHLQYGKPADLDSMDYNRAAKLAEGGRFISYPRMPWAWDIKNSEDGEAIIQKLVQAGAPRCQLRFQFFTSTNWDGISDMFCFDNAVLTIKYTMQ
jgi:hypothetical protein